MRTRPDSKRYDFSENGTDGALVPMTVVEIQLKFFSMPDGKTFRSYGWLRAGLEAGATTVAALVAQAELRYHRGLAAGRDAGRRSSFGQTAATLFQKGRP